ncbi:MAG: ATP-binding protein [Cyanobacteria bacterium P01_F01_bin.150]
MRYTYQFIPAINALNGILAKIPSDQLIYRIAQITENPFDWKLVYYLTVPINEELRKKGLRLAFPGGTYEINTTPRLDTFVQATAAGFWYLYREDSPHAAQAFEVVRDIAHGEEMYQLATSLNLYNGAKTVDAIVSLSLPASTLRFAPSPIFHGKTWEAIQSFYKTIEDTQLVQRSVAKATRSLALNRAIGYLTQIIQTQNQLPIAERALVVSIAQTWKEAIESVALDVGQTEILEPIRNPYIIGDPVLGEQFTGRDDIMRQLEELWITNQTLQSIVIYGHRRMGKTSILRNATANIGSQTQVIYINLQNLGSIDQGVGEVLLAISDEISDAVGIAPPTDDAFLQLPQRTFERYLKHILTEMPHSGLIIALDEFETLETLIQSGQLSPAFLGYLRGLVQKDPRLAFAFAGLHTLEEMTADYFQPFFASVIPIRVSFLNRDATFQILATPSDDFPLDYHPDALQTIYDLTYGQPYLTQLIGFYLVRHYNDYVFEQGRQRDNLITVDDINAIINEQFFQRGRYYFDGVWRQASEGAPGQQQVMQLLAFVDDGLTTNELAAQCPDVVGLGEAIATLERHDVIKQNENEAWSITVDLLKTWLQNYAPKAPK